MKGLVPFALLAFTLASILDSNGATTQPQGDQETARIEGELTGKWVQYQETPIGRYMTIKEHDGKQTIVTMYDPQQHVVYSHRSDYTVDCTGDVCIFTFRNKTVLVGPNAGAVEKEPVSYLFRIDGDQFLEVNGMLKDDKQKPSLKIWERLKVDPRPDSKA